MQTGTIMTTTKKPRTLNHQSAQDSESDKKSASQHQDQDNFCYRGDECEQANQGQQIVGKDNDAKGFNDQSDNLSVSTTQQERNRKQAMVMEPEMDGNTSTRM